MTTVSGVLPGMFPILTRPFPHEQSASPDRLPIHHLRPLGAARDAVFPARQRLAGAGRAGTEIVVGQHPIERARPRGGGERRPAAAGTTGTPSAIASSSACDNPSIREGSAASVANR